jgi:hypothetical protein
VQAQTVDPAAIDVVKLVVTLGGGAGIAAILKEIAWAIVEFMKTRKGTVKIQQSDGKTISLDGYTAEQVSEILAATGDGR